MADENLNSKKALDPEQYRKIGEDALDILGALNDITNAVNQSAKSLSRETQGSAKQFSNSFSEAKKLGEQLKGISAETLKDKQAGKKLDSQVKKVEAELLANQRQRRRLYLQSLNAKGKEKQLLLTLVNLYDEANISTQAQLDGTKELYKELKRIDNDVQLWDDIADAVKDIPVLSKVFKDFSVAAKEAREASADGKATTTAILKNYGKALGKATRAFTIGTIIKGLKLGDELTTQFSRSLNVTADEAANLRDQVTRVSISGKSLTSAKEYADILVNTSKTLGISAELSDSQLKTMGLMTKELGLSQEASQNLLKISETRGQGLEKESKQIVGQTMLLNERNKVNIRYQDVLEDIGKASSATLLTTQRFPGGIAKAAFEARKFGLNLMSLEKSGEALLNFESSIEAELEAELLLGKELNLERARAAALTGDQATLAAELAKNFGTAEEFSSQNVLAQRAQAEAMGMTREELAEALLTQEAITKLGGDQSKSLEANYKARLKQVEAMAEGEEKTKAMAKLAEDVAGTELERQLENRSAAEATQKAMQALQEAAAQFSIVLKPITWIMEGIANHAKIALGLLTAISVLSFGRILKSLRGVGTALKSLTSFGSDAAKTTKLNSAGQLIDAKTGKYVKKPLEKATTKVAEKTGAKSLTKLGGKLGGKMLLKRIPILGTLMGLGFAVDRAIKGDWTGAGLEATSGLANLLDFVAPGVGTGISMAMDAGIAARDLSQAGTVTPNSGGAMKVDDFTIRTNPEDTLVMAGGTKFGDETNALIQELINAVKQGGNVYMDSMAVGHSTALSTSRLG